MENILRISIIIVFAFTFKNIYGQEVDIEPPVISFSRSEISVEYEENINSITLFVDCSYNFPEDYYAFLPTFEVTDYSDSVTWTVEDYSYDWGNASYIERYIFAYDTSGNNSYYSFIVRSSEIKDFSKIIIKVNDSEFEYDGSTSVAEETLNFCDGTNVTMTASIIWDCSSTFEKYHWALSIPYSNPYPHFFEENSISFNMDTLTSRNKVLLNVGENIFSATFNINKKDNEGVVNKYPPTYPNSSNGSIILSNASNIAWEYNTSSDSSITDLKMGLYPVRYDYDGCTFEDTIKLQSLYHLSFDVLSPYDDIIDSIINIYDTQYFLFQNQSTYETGYTLFIGDSIYNNPNSFWFKPDSTGELTIKLVYNDAEIKDSLIKKYNVVSVDTVAPKFKINYYMLYEDDPYYESYNEELNVLTISTGDWCSSTIDYNSIDFNEYFTVKDNTDSIIITYTDTLDYRYFEARDTSGNYSILKINVTIPLAPGPINSTSLIVNNLRYYSDGFEPIAEEVDFCENEVLTLIAGVDFGCAQDNAPNEYHWYINDIIFDIGDSIKLSLDTMDYQTSVRVEATKSGYSESIKIKIYNIKKDSLIKTIDPTCSNSNDGFIKFDANVVDATLLKHNDSGSDLSLDYKYNNSSNEIYFDSLDAGTYYISYLYIVFNDNSETSCNFVDTLKLEPGNILNFTPTKTVIDLSKKEELTITNNSTPDGDFSWQIGDSSFINNENEFDYAFKSPGNYKIKLTVNNGFCNDTIVKNITVEKSTTVFDNSIPSIKIGPNPFTDVLNFEMQKSSEYKITIYGVDGRVYFTDQVRDMKNFNVDLSFLNSGIYVLKIAAEENSELINGYKIVKFDY